MYAKPFDMAHSLVKALYPSWDDHLAMLGVERPFRYTV